MTATHRRTIVYRARNLASYIGIAISLAAALGLLDGPIAALWGGS